MIARIDNRGIKGVYEIEIIEKALLIKFLLQNAGV
jgi:hypothetical protein